MATVENLKPFEQGKSGNPKGRPKGSLNRATVFKKLLALKAEKVLTDATEAEKGLTLMEAAALGQLLSARKGNTNAWKEIQDSIHGKIADKTEHTGEGGGPIQTKIIVEIVNGTGTTNGTDTN